MRVQYQRDETASKKNRKNEGEFYPENIDLECTIKEKGGGTIERREWTSGETSGTCVVWCKWFTF